MPPLPDPQLKPKAQTCPFFTVAERAAMHPERRDGAEVQGVFGATLKGQPKQFVWFRGKIQGRLATPGQHGNLQLKSKWQELPEGAKKRRPQTLNSGTTGSSWSARYSSAHEPTKYRRAPSGQVTFDRHG